MASHSFTLMVQRCPLKCFKILSPELLMKPKHSTNLTGDNLEQVTNKSAIWYRLPHYTENDAL